MDKRVADNINPRGGIGRWALGAAALGAAWLVVRSKSRRAESMHPPSGEFIEVNGLRLHYLSQGEGPVVVLLHGNGVLAEDFRHAGLLEQLALNHRVIAFDRPGFGYSDRPRGTWWTPAAQAALLAAALDQLGVERAVVLAHSWATLVAVSLGLQRPQLVQALVLASGYYYPSVRLDVLTATPAIPVIGDVLSHTISPLLGRLIWPLAIKRAFAPSAVPDSFRRLSPWMALRPKQLRAEAEETAMMIPSAAMLHAHYPELRMPVAIVAGDADAIASAQHNSVRLQRDIDGSELTLLPGEGHMIQHLSQYALVAAVERVGQAATEAQDDVADGAATVVSAYRANGAAQPEAVP